MTVWSSLISKDNSIHPLINNKRNIWFLFPKYKYLNTRKPKSKLIQRHKFWIRLHINKKEAFSLKSPNSLVKQPRTKSISLLLNNFIMIIPMNHFNMIEEWFSYYQESKWGLILKRHSSIKLLLRKKEDLEPWITKGLCIS